MNKFSGISVLVLVLIGLVFILNLIVVQDKDYYCPKEMQYYQNDLLATVSIDIKQPFDTLVKQLKATKIDFSASYYINATMEIDDKTIHTPFKFYPDYGTFCGLRKQNKIWFIYNKYNMLLVGNELLESKSDTVFYNRFSEITKERLEFTQKPYVFYNMEWSILLDKKALENRLHQITNAIRRYSEELAQEQFGKAICDLDDKQIQMLKESYVGIISFEEVVPFEIEIPNILIEEADSN